MGSSGSWSAELKLVRSITITQQTENTDQEIDEFLNNIPTIYVNKTRYELYGTGKQIYTVIDEDDENIDKIADYYKNKDSMTIEEYEALVENGEDSLDPYQEFEVMEDKEVLRNKLRFIDLKKAEEYKYFIDFKYKNIFPTIDHTIYLTSIGATIYEIDEDSNDFIITQEFIDSLKPGDRLEISGEWSVYG